jgi:aryl-alcohol dehydrogenase-like predicted oxidoreductase
MLAVEDSLRRLGTDWLDVYYLHHIDVQAPLEEALRALDDLVRQGKVRYPAVSNFEAWRLLESAWLCQANGWAAPACYQPQYSLVVRDIEEEIVPVCTLKGIGVAVWSPLAGGFLAGRYRPGEHRAAGSRSEEGWSFPLRYFHPAHDAILAELLAVAKEVGRTPAQVALRWILERPWITSAIVGGRNAQQFEDSLQAAAFRLPPEAIQRLDHVSALPRRYPRSMEAGMAKRRDDAVGRG